MEALDSSRVLQSSQDGRRENGPLNSVCGSRSSLVEIDSLKRSEVSANNPTLQNRADATSLSASHSTKVIDHVTSPAGFGHPPKMRAFQMSAHEDYLELDDDVHVNGVASTQVSEGGEPIELSKKSAAIPNIHLQHEAIAADKPAVPEQKPPENSLLTKKESNSILDGSVTSAKATGFTFPAVPSSSPAFSLGLQVPITSQSISLFDKAAAQNELSNAVPAFSSISVKLPAMTSSTISSILDSSIQKDTKSELSNSSSGSAHFLSSLSTPLALDSGDDLSIFDSISFTPSPLIEYSSGESAAVLSPGGKEFIPCCPLNDKPVIGKTFPSLSSAGLNFIRIIMHLFVDLRQGFILKGLWVLKLCLSILSVIDKDIERAPIKQLLMLLVLIRRRTRAVIRVGCKAFIAFKFDKNGVYYVLSFHVGHNHPMLTPTSRHHLKRNLNIGLQHVIAANHKINKGPNISFRATKEIMGDYDNIGASLVDFKNFTRDLKLFIGDNDAQMFVDILDKRKEICPSFCFEYDTDDDGCLIRCFWSDPIGQRNYFMFGDSVSFDSTFKTNKYSLIFCPFTGIDHHNKCASQ